MTSDVEKIVSGLTEALQSCRLTTSRPPKLHKFRDRPIQPTDPSLDDWLEDVQFYCDQLQIQDNQIPSVIISHLEGPAKAEVKCHSGLDKNKTKLIKVLQQSFGTRETVQSLLQSFYDRTQWESETLEEFSRELIRLYDRAVDKAPESEAAALKLLRDKSLINQFVAGTRHATLRLELKRIQLSSETQTFETMRELALNLLVEYEGPKGEKSNIRELLPGAR